MTHIVHFEDLLFQNNIKGIHQIFDRHNDYYVKYDGSMSIVYGVNAAGNKFVTSKSFFNKKYSTRRMCYDCKDVDKYFAGKPDVIEMFKYILTDMEFPFDPQLRHVAVQADMIFTPSSRGLFDGNYGICQPNLVKYKFPWAMASIKKQDMYHMENHTLIWFSYGKNVDEMTYRTEPIGTAFSYKVDTYDTSFIPTIRSFDFTPVETELLIAFSNNQVWEGVKFSTAEDFKKFALLKKNYPQADYNALVSRVDIDHVLSIHRALRGHKHVMLMDLNNMANEHPFTLKTYSDIPNVLAWHEGFVTEIGGGEKVKFVSRETFSYMNHKKWKDKEEQ